jgi:hypothetical protein
MEGESMTKHLKIASMLALSTAAAVGLSLVASNAQAAENVDDENMVLNEDNTAVEADEGMTDEGMTDESSDAIHRRYFRWPGFYYPPTRYFYHRPYYRHYFPRYRYYHPYNDRYFRPGIHPRCDRWGNCYVW